MPDNPTDPMELARMVERGELPSGSVVVKLTGDNSVHTAAAAPAKPKPTRVVITMEVFVDEAAWCLTYGGILPVALRQDVKDYVLGAVQGSAAADEGCITEANLVVRR